MASITTTRDATSYNPNKICIGTMFQVNEKVKGKVFSGRLYYVPDCVISWLGHMNPKVSSDIVKNDLSVK